MTLISGIFLMGEAESLNASDAYSLRESISRHETDVPRLITSARFCMAKVDMGALLSPGLIEDSNGSISALAGEPILPADGCSNRADDLASLHAQWQRLNWSGLRRARGTYCAAHLDSSGSGLHLIVDKLAVRPLYFWSDGRRFVFASALRIMEQLVPLEVAPRGATEMAAMKYPLGDRTPYSGIHCMLPGSVLHITKSGITTERYWRWDQVPEQTGTPRDITRRLYVSFTEAIRLRLARDRAAHAFLSGGLDSRAIVAGLTEQGVHPYTFNFSWKNSLDSVLGARFAEAIGASHTQETLPASDSGDAWPGMIGRAVSEARHHPDRIPSRPYVVWSGDGGSVGLGHTYITEVALEHLRRGDIARTVLELERCMHTALAVGAHRRETAAHFAQIPRQGMEEQLAALHCPDPARNLFVFLLENDQRRHLSVHFENIDVNRVEYALPFFDADFLAIVTGAPMDLFLRHRLYMEWLGEFSGPVLTVPWQAYPGHAPCPLPLPEGLVPQWGLHVRTEAHGHQKKMGQEAARILSSRYFPDSIIDRKRLRIAGWLTRFGLRDYSYLIEVARVYHKYWNRSRGACGDLRLLLSEAPRRNSEVPAQRP